MRSPPTGSLRRAAFTILELLLTLVLITVVATISIEAWFGRSEVTLQKAAELLASDLRELQVRATIERTAVEVLFDADGGGYRGHALGQPDDGLPLRRYDRDAVFEGVRIAAIRVDGGGALVFDSIGRPASDATVTLESRGETRTVLIDSELARITIDVQHEP